MSLKSATRSYKMALRTRVAATKIHASVMASYHRYIKARHARVALLDKSDDERRRDELMNATKDLVESDRRLIDAMEELNAHLVCPVLVDDAPNTESPPPSPSYPPSPDSEAESEAEL